MWTAVTAYAAFLFVQTSVGMILGMNREVERRKSVNFALLSGLMLTAFAFLGTGIARLLLMINNSRYFAGLLFLGITAVLVIKTVNINKMALIFATDDRNNFMLSCVTMGLDAMIASIGCTFAFQYSHIVLISFLPLFLIVGVLGVTIGLKTRTLLPLRILMAASCVALFCAFLTTL